MAQKLPPTAEAFVFWVVPAAGGEQAAYGRSFCVLGSACGGLETGYILSIGAAIQTKIP
ncbi:hypothetical protein [Chitinophaga sp.]|uniref:hypothetical protein n=1 Tax=Chitinophaga sp. TaxID=1869181 RepID=UPI0031D670ED